MVGPAGEAPIDRYVVTEHLSEGGMGAIYVGKKLGAGGFEMEVVLKQLLPEFTQQAEFIDLFLREAKLSATLDHANIVHTIDLVTAGSEYFIVMEYLPGGDLRTLLKKAKRRGKRFSPAAAIYVSREVLSALAYAHVKRDFEGKPLRLIHRDVSPSNVLLSYAGEVKLTDFGIAKASTHTSLFYKVKGKIGYMSPEQAKSEPLDHRSDLYSLAVCLYEILTGERLFVHAGLTTSADEIYSQPVPLVSRKVSGLPQELDAIVQKALAIDPEARYQTAGELQEALMRCAHRNGLLLSAPELATELLDACGPHDAWRGDDDDDDFDELPRAGTEVYDGGDGDDDGDGDEAFAAGPISVHDLARKSASIKLPRPRTELGQLKKMELTSIINMIDLEQQGAQPLVDLSAAAAPQAPAPFAPMLPLDSGQALTFPAAPEAVRSATPPPLSPSEQMPAQRAPSIIDTQPPRQGTLAPPKPRGARVKPWMVIVVLAVVALVVMLVVALSGPSIHAGK